MPVLAPNQNIQLGPYQQGAVLRITQVGNVTNGSITNNSIPLYDGSGAIIQRVPKDITMTQRDVHTLTASNAAVTYEVRQ